MLDYLIRRLTVLLATLLAASLIVFTVLAVLPGDPAQVILGMDATEEALAALRRELGVDRPLPMQYLGWIGGLFQGEMGVSYAYRTPVAELVGERLAVTLPLAAMAFLLAVVLALPLGLFAALRHNRSGDYVVMAFAQAGLAIPNFWFGILLILLFAVHLQWFAAGGFVGWEESAAGAVRSLLLPAVALALSEAAILARVVRSTTLDAYREDYVRTARAKGLGEGQVLWGHVLRNALIPVATIMGLQVAFLIAGAVVVENVFYLPGLGRLLLQSIFQRDLIVVQNIVLLLSGLVVVINFAVDIAYVLIDPRARTVR